MKKYVSIIFLLFFSSLIYSEGSFSKSFQSYYESRLSKLMMLSNVKDLQRTHWIPKLETNNLDFKDYLEQTMQEELIFLSNNQLLIINTGVSCVYSDKIDEYIFDTIFISIFSEFEYKILNDEEIDCSKYQIKLLNDELYVQDKSNNTVRVYVISNVF